jgi:hypothetical protein
MSLLLDTVNNIFKKTVEKVYRNYLRLPNIRQSAKNRGFRF